MGQKKEKEVHEKPAVRPYILNNNDDTVSTVQKIRFLLNKAELLLVSADVAECKWVLTRRKAPSRAWWHVSRRFVFVAPCFVTRRSLNCWKKHWREIPRVKVTTVECWDKLPNYLCFNFRLRRGSWIHFLWLNLVGRTNNRSKKKHVSI